VFDGGARNSEFVESSMRPLNLVRTHRTIWIKRTEMTDGSHLQLAFDFGCCAIKA
jgi:hypothetical protein